MNEAERNLVQQWLVKAKHDLAAAQLIAGAADPYLDMALFHLQQAAEKAVKAYLAFRNQPFRKTHDMEELVSLAATLDARFEAWIEPADDLTPFATDFRYPMMRELTRAEYDQALQTAQNLFAFVLSVLPAEVHPTP